MTIDPKEITCPKCGHTTKTNPRYENNGFYDWLCYYCGVCGYIVEAIEPLTPKEKEGKEI